ncbi:glycosyltransferase, partial [Acinetobacter baumannii]
RFDRYMRDYGLPWLAPVAWRWMRRFHDGADATLVPTAELASELQRAGVRRVLRLPRAVDTALFDPRWRDETLRAGWGARPQGP